MRKEILFSILFFVALFGFLFSLTSGAGEVITNEKLYEAIGGKSHTVMAKQRERLQEVLEGFLAGDWQRIQAPLSKMRQDIDRIGNQYTQYSEANIPSLQALGEMRKELIALQTQVEAQNYEEAYRHFQAIPYQCIQCHQVQRSWGKFEVAKDAEEEAEGAKGDGKEKEEKKKGPPEPAVGKVVYQ